MCFGGKRSEKRRVPLEWGRQLESRTNYKQMGRNNNLEPKRKGILKKGEKGKIHKTRIKNKN